MALSFPASPTVGQQYTDSNRTWEWNGQTWEAISSADFGTGTLTIPVSSSLPTGEGQIVFDGTTDTLHIGEGVGSIQIAKDADIPQSIIELGIADGTAGQFLSTDGAGNFIFATVAGGSGATTLDELTDVTTSGATNGQVLTADGAGNFTFSSIAGGGAETVTSLAYNNATSMLTYTDEAGADTVLDLTNLLDDTNIITDVNGQTGSVSLTLDNLADVTAAGSTVGQMLTSDGAGAYTFTTPYGDLDVATFLDGNLNANIIPNANITYDIGTDSAQIRFGYISRAYVAELMANYMIADGEIILRANNGTPQAVRPYGVGGFGSNLGSTSYPWNETHTDNITVNTSLSVDGTVNTNLTPDTTGTYDLGNNGARWNEVHANDGKFQAVSAFNYTSAGQMIFTSGSDFVFQGTRINGPSANALDIGENSFPLKTIYTNNIQVNTTLTIPINNTANTADGSMTWDGTNNKLYVGDGTTAIEIGAGAGGGYGDADVATYLNGNLDTHIIPDTNATYDIGAAEFKIRHLYLSDNSLKFVNASNTEYSMGVDGDGELTFQSVKLSDAAVAKVTSADLDMAGNRVLFANVYTNLADLPDATAYHGMFAHVHSEAAAYYAHAGSWTKLANDGAGGGGVANFVATGAIATGEIVGLRSDGTIEKISNTLTPGTNTVGSNITWANTAINYIGSSYNPTENKIVIAYRQGGAGYAVVGEVSGDTITFGTGVNYAASVENVEVSHDPVNNKELIAYKDPGNNNRATAIVATISGNSISFGSPVVFGDTDSAPREIVYDTASGNHVVMYSNGAGNNGRVVVATISGTSVSFGIFVEFNAASTTFIKGVYESSQNKVVISYASGGSQIILGTVSGTSITLTSPITWSASNYYSYVAFDSNSNKVVLVYQDSGDNNYGKAVVGTVSGNSFSVGSPVTYYDVGGIYNGPIAFDAGANKVVTSFQNSSSEVGYFVTGSVSGDTITFSTHTEFWPGTPDFQNLIFDSTNNKTVVAWMDYGSNDHGMAAVITVGPDNLTTNADSWIGIAKEAIADAATGQVNIVSGTATGLSGLTAGTTYFVNYDGTLTSTENDGPTTGTYGIIGRALSATELLIVEGVNGLDSPNIPSDISELTDNTSLLSSGGATTLDALTDVTAAGSANGEVLTSDGAGNFTFGAVSAQLGRNQYAGTTASLADQASSDLDVTGCKTYTLFKIQTDVAAWVTIYTDAASRTADTRTYADKGSDPATEGVVAEVITTGAQTIIVAPSVIGFNNEGTPTTNIPMRVFNDSGGAATVTVTVDVLTLEA